MMSQLSAIYERMFLIIISWMSISSPVSFVKKSQPYVVPKFVRATASSDNFYDNIDIVLPKIEGQIRKYRTRFDQRSKISAYKEKAVYFGGEEKEDKSIVKEKRFTLNK